MRMRRGCDAEDESAVVNDGSEGGRRIDFVFRLRARDEAGVVGIEVEEDCRARGGVVVEAFIMREKAVKKPQNLFAYGAVDKVRCFGYLSSLLLTLYSVIVQS